MNRLTPHECRVLGVLVEKAHTTPGQYPLTLNALVNGANQRSNRLPVLSLTEDDAIEALDGLRNKGLSREVMLSGSRVEKYRHVAREGLGVTTAGLVILTELLLRGPQTTGEIRGRATRMHTLETLDVVETELAELMGRDEPLVRRVAPASGSRSHRYAQLLCPDLHRLDDIAPGPPDAAAGAPAGAPARAGTGATPADAPPLAGPGAEASQLAHRQLEERVERLEADVATLKAIFERTSGASAP